MEFLPVLSHSLQKRWFTHSLWKSNTFGATSTSNQPRSKRFSVPLIPYLLSSHWPGNSHMYPHFSWDEKLLLPTLQILNMEEVKAWLALPEFKAIIWLQCGGHSKLPASFKYAKSFSAVTYQNPLSICGHREIWVFYLSTHTHMHRDILWYVIAANDFAYWNVYVWVCTDTQLLEQIWFVCLCMNVDIACPVKWTFTNFTVQHLHAKIAIKTNTHFKKMLIQDSGWFKIPHYLSVS